MTIAEISRLTGLMFCDANCPCCGNLQLFFSDDRTRKEWWMVNGWTKEDVEAELRRRAMMPVEVCREHPC